MIAIGKIEPSKVFRKFSASIAVLVVRYRPIAVWRERLAGGAR